jgi:anti-sigma factor RsiW
MTAFLENDNDLMMQAYLDGELDPAAMSAFERRLSDDAALRSRYEQLIALRGALRSLPQSDPPVDLLRRVTAQLDAEGRGQSDRNQKWSWRSLAAAAIIGAVLTFAAMTAFDQYRSRQDTVQQVVASHVRGLLASQPFDIASSDRHTVKPWFTQRTVQAPQVVDLAEQGFTLVGGRIDIINGEPVATMVYRHANHIVSLTVLKAGRPVPEEIVDGYRVRSWTEGNLTYVAVCDLSGQDLALFQRAFMAKGSG